MDKPEMKRARNRAVSREEPEPRQESSRRPRLAGGDEPFTRYVRALAERAEDLGALAEEVTEKLKRVLVVEMKSRSLWLSPPSYVGVYGYTSWTPPGDATVGPLEELLHECYVALFGERQVGRLVAQLKVKADIEGLVRRSLRHFLGRRQKEHDPLGYRLFEIVSAAVGEAVAAREVCVLEGPPEIRNATVLGASPEANPRQAAPEDALRPIVKRWVTELMPGLVTAERGERRQVTERLRAHLFDMEAEGIEVFRFQELIDAVKWHVRQLQAEDFDRGEGEAAPQVDDEGERALVRVFHPRNRVEDAESFRKLVDCVANLIPRLGRQARTERHLERLWTYLRRFALGFEDERLPSRRALAARLKISRDRMPDLFDTLRFLVEQCRARLSGAVVDLGARRGGARHG